MTNRRAVLLAVLTLAAAAACYRIYDGLEDRWNVFYSMSPAGGGSCTPSLDYGMLEVARSRSAGLRGSFVHDSLVCDTPAGPVTIVAGDDTILGGQVFDQSPDSLFFTLARQDTSQDWTWGGTQVERHFLRGTSRLTINDTIVINGTWQAERQ